MCFKLVFDIIVHLCLYEYGDLMSLVLRTKLKTALCGFSFKHGIDVVCILYKYTAFILKF